jgi:hypothetical protein
MILHFINMESVLDIILFVGITQGSLLSLALFSMKRGNTTVNRILAILLFSFSFLIFFHAHGIIMPNTRQWANTGG